MSKKKPLLDVASPHCDSSILHGPLAECIYCDQFPEWQELRKRWRINFTGENDPKKAPCPSTHFRPLDVIEKWHGNVPMTSERHELDHVYYSELASCMKEVFGKASHNG